MKWHKAKKELPPIGQIVLVKYGDYNYMVCQLGYTGDLQNVKDPLGEIGFFPWSDDDCTLKIEKGMRWAKIKLPKDGE